MSLCPREIYPIDFAGEGVIAKIFELFMTRPWETHGVGVHSRKRKKMPIKFSSDENKLERIKHYSGK
jgi:hypothetical protein